MSAKPYKAAFHLKPQSKKMEKTASRREPRRENINKKPRQRVTMNRTSEDDHFRNTRRSEKEEVPSVTRHKKWTTQEINGNKEPVFS
jgi:hypothetical protein